MESTVFIQIMRNLHQIYDTPIYQARQMFREKFSGKKVAKSLNKRMRKNMQHILQFSAQKNAKCDFYEGNP